MTRASVAGGAPALRFRDLDLGYDGEAVLHGIDGTVGRGALLAVVGPNGAGKSTLFKGVTGELPPLAGAVDRCGLGPRDIAVMPQRAAIDRTFPIAVADMVAAGLWRVLGLGRSLGAAGRRRVADVLGAVGLGALADRPIGTLSGGQFQRALFARLMLQDAPLILLDEPFAAVDHDTTADLMTIVAGWHAEGRTVLAALHDLAQVRAAFPETLLLAGRAIAWGPTATVLTDANLAAAQNSACAHAAPPSRRAGAGAR